MCDYCKGTTQSRNITIQDEDDIVMASLSYCNGVIEIVDIGGDYMEWKVPYCPMCGKKIN